MSDTIRQPFVASSDEADRLQTLYQVNDLLSQVIAKGTSLHEVLPRVLRLTVRELGAAEGNLVLIDERRRPLHVWSLSGDKYETSPISFPAKALSRGLFRWVSEEMRTAVVDDTQDDERWLEVNGLAPAEESWSALCSPLVIQQRVIGIVTLLKPGTAQFKRREVDLLTAIANQTAGAVEGARLVEEVRRRAGKLGVLFGAAASIVRSLDRGEIMSNTSHQLANLLEVDACVIFANEPERRDLSERMVALRAEDDDWRKTITQLDATAHQVFKDLLRDSQPKQFRADDVSVGGPESLLLQELNVESALLLPMVAHEQVTGSALLMDRTEFRTFSHEQINLAQSLANQAAVAVENAQLFERAQRQLRVSALLNEASRVINSTLDTNEIMRSLLAQANELFNAEAISIALVDKGKDVAELVYVVAEGAGSDKILGLRLPANQGVSGWVMANGEPAMVKNMSEDPRFYRQADERTGHNTRGMMCAPLQVKGEVLGTIQAINPREETFTDDNLELLVNLANLAGIALANAEQYARTQAAEARYLSLFEDSINPILLTDDDGVIVEANRRASDFLGYEPDELKGKTVRRLHLEGDARIALPTLSEVREENVETFESWLALKSGGSIPVEGHVKRTRSGDNELLQWIFRDITQQVELAEMREDLMAMLVHDLQSPLGNVISSLELLRYELPSETDEVLQAILEIATRSSRRLQSLIRSLLDISHLEAGHSLTDLKYVSLASLLDEASEMVQPTLERRQVTIVREFSPELPPIYVDDDMIRRVLLNLLDNACKYTPLGKAVTVAAREIPGSPLVHISVSDQGTGIPEQYREDIFEKFRRLQGKDAPKGMGLGLAFSRLAVEAHGGRIWVDDGPEGGARFNFTLPHKPLGEGDGP
jgi:PAS domain S-box-containing protein